MGNRSIGGKGHPSFHPSHQKPSKPVKSNAGKSPSPSTSNKNGGKKK